MNYIHAIELVMKQDTLIVLLDKLWRCFRPKGRQLSLLAKFPMLPQARLTFTSFNRCLAHAVGYDFDGLIPAIA